MPTITDRIRAGIVTWLFGSSFPLDARRKAYERQRRYTTGDQDEQLRVRWNGPNDNVALNFIGLVVNRAVSRLFGDVIDFDLPGDDDTPQAEHVNGVWDANKREILLRFLGWYGAVYGTVFVKLIPDAVATPDERVFPKLSVLDPRWMEVETDPQDYENVIRYVQEYKVGDDGYMEVTERGESTGWTVTNFKSENGGKWEQVAPPIFWEYDFAPIMHWQNLPQPGSAYGRSDIADVLDVQDRVNFIASNVTKIIRHHAHPKPWGRGIGKVDTVNWGPDEMVIIPSENGMVGNLEMQSDLASSQAFLNLLRQALFDMTQTVDLSSIADKIGALTNFGLRVLYQDEISKLTSKRALYGDALNEINHRLLVLAGFSGAQADPGEVVWPPALDVNELEEIQALTADNELGIVSKQTIAAKRGYNWEQEQERIAEQQAGEDNIGAALLRAFNRGEQ